MARIWIGRGNLILEKKGHLTPRFGDKYILDVLHMILQEYYRREAPLSYGETILSLNNFEYEIDELKKKKKKKKCP